MRRNEELLTQLRVRETARALAVVAEPTKRARLATKRRAAEVAPIEPTRRSARARGAKAKAMEIGEDDQIVDGEEGLEHHLTCDEYCERLGIEPGPKMTSFTGWVEESVRERLGIASSANEAWERNGGENGADRRRDRRKITRRRCCTRIQTRTSIDTRLERSKLTVIGARTKSSNSSKLQPSTAPATSGASSRRISLVELVTSAQRRIVTSCFLEVSFVTTLGG